MKNFQKTFAAAAIALLPSFSQASGQENLDYTKPTYIKCKDVYVFYNDSREAELKMLSHPIRRAGMTPISLVGPHPDEVKKKETVATVGTWALQRYQYEGIYGQFKNLKLGVKSRFETKYLRPMLGTEYDLRIMTGAGFYECRITN